MEEISKEDLVKRLKRIEGQVRGLQRMIEEERDCGDILIQVSAVVSALSKVSELTAKSYAHKCIVEMNEKGDTSELDALIESIIKLRRF
ncbi:MAG: hypothetical protein DRP32_08170 [Thermotogae bacterium]|uniref:Transcriptional regulator n=1 Tax=Kosmotoga arenicorallina TaxID=688066 RepID=A0A7C5HXK5_9BACT|nr:metal-sensitive transcriptional regulator [Kosmotoga sp.]MBO8167056.1 metal-sensitive transcriptional regulator [Kosmotoga sp.]MCD6159584.1 metal-sensitive transcriptional regulator [Kosmotoga sp.]RKX47975.1 MAG: hypothetical protein DRP32_08170 [Thermotogota bacterium]HHF08591.1 transcriptional regulator [Kosmotoga arenicorallina]